MIELPLCDLALVVPCPPDRMSHPSLAYLTRYSLGCGCEGEAIDTDREGTAHMPAIVIVHRDREQMTRICDWMLYSHVGPRREDVISVALIDRSLMRRVTDSISPIRSLILMTSRLAGV